MKNIKVKEYARLEDTLSYNSVLDSVDGVNLFAGYTANFQLMPYSKVKDIERQIQQGCTFDQLGKLYNDVFGCSLKEFGEAGVVEFFQARNYIKETLKELKETESKLLKSMSGFNESAWIEAGGESLANFSPIMPLVQLGKIYGMFPFDVGEKPYCEVFLLLVLHKRDDEVQKRYGEITRPKPSKK